jgi:AcrR family transcriptional regulator
MRELAARRPKGKVKETLLEATRSCLARVGYRRTTARAIAEEAGANLHSINYHYGSVRELALLALSQNFRQWMAPLVADLSSEPDPRRGLADGIAAFSDSLSEHEPLVRAWLEAVADAQDDPELRTQLADNQAWFRRRLAANLAAAGAEYPDDGAAALITICDGLMVRHLLHGAATTPAQVALAAQAALMHIIGTEPG